MCVKEWRWEDNQIWVNWTFRLYKKKQKTENWIETLPIKSIYRKIALTLPEDWFNIEKCASEYGAIATVTSYRIKFPLLQENTAQTFTAWKVSVFEHVLDWQNMSDGHLVVWVAGKQIHLNNWKKIYQFLTLHGVLSFRNNKFECRLSQNWKIS